MSDANLPHANACERFFPVAANRRWPMCPDIPLRDRTRDSSRPALGDSGLSDLRSVPHYWNRVINKAIATLQFVRLRLFYISTEKGRPVSAYVCCRPCWRTCFEKAEFVALTPVFGND